MHACAFLCSSSSGAHCGCGSHRPHRYAVPLPPPIQQREEARQNHSLLPEGHRYVQLVSGFGCLGDEGACWGFRVADVSGGA